MISQRVGSMLRMTMADVADAADSFGGAFRLENADTCLTPPAHVLRGDARGGRRRRVQLVSAAAGPEGAARRDRRPVRGRLGRLVRPRGRDRRLVRGGRVAVERAADADRPGRQGAADEPDLQRDGAARAAGGRRAGVHPARCVAGGSIWCAGRAMPAAAGCCSSPRRACRAGRCSRRRRRRRSREVAVENDAWIVFNGHADKVAFGGAPVTLPGPRSRTILVGCMSKNYVMPGWRVGWALGPREVMRAMEDVHIFNGVMPSGFCQVGAAAALSGDQAWQARGGARRTSAGRPRCSPRCRPGRRDPGRGRLLLPARHAARLPAPSSPRSCCAERVAVTPMQGWGSDDFGEHFVRLIFTNEPEDRLREAGRRIARFSASR